MSYQGSANRQTWTVALWLDNEADSYNMVTEFAEKTLEYNDGDRHEAKKELASIIRNMYCNHVPELHGVYGDLVAHALAVVDWWEIAEGFIDDVEYEEEW